MGIGAGNHHVAGLDRLAQGLEHRAGKFRQFVEKQHAVMREADLARLGATAAALRESVRAKLDIARPGYDAVADDGR